MRNISTYRCYRQHKKKGGHIQTFRPRSFVVLLARQKKKNDEEIKNIRDRYFDRETCRVFFLILRVRDFFSDLMLVAFIIVFFFFIDRDFRLPSFLFTSSVYFFTLPTTFLLCVCIGKIKNKKIKRSRHERG